MLRGFKGIATFLISSSRAKVISCSTVSSEGTSPAVELGFLRGITTIVCCWKEDAIPND